jgi:predicted lipase
MWIIIRNLKNFRNISLFFTACTLPEPHIQIEQEIQTKQEKQEIRAKQEKQEIQTKQEKQEIRAKQEKQEIQTKQEKQEIQTKQEKQEIQTKQVSPSHAIFFFSHVMFFFRIRSLRQLWLMKMMMKKFY